MYDPEAKKILLVQSLSQYFGMPKGTIEKGETPMECAIRETLEETGLKVHPSEFTKIEVISGRAVYYYLERKMSDVNSFWNPATEFSNDSTGITWIHVNCLEDCVQNGTIILNKDAKILCKRLLNIF
jgi:8-oxo-dGTP pyrophosphatase MutT (NUDIX family)